MDIEEMIGKRNEEINLSQANFSEVKQDETNLEKLNIPDLLPTLSSMSFVMAMTMLFLILSKFWLATGQALIKYVPQKVPCRKCRYFSNNSHLQCAVHPLIVLREESINCSDYWPKDSQFSH